MASALEGKVGLTATDSRRDRRMLKDEKLN